MDTKFDSYSNNNGAKIDSILEGIITLMRQIDEIKQQGEKLSNRIDKLEHNQQVILRNTGDSMIMSNNNTNDIVTVNYNQKKGRTLSSSFFIYKIF